MGLKSILAKPYAAFLNKRIKAWSLKAVSIQQSLLTKLLSAAADTAFGREHNFKDIKSHREFIKAVPLRDYEKLSSYIERIVAGESDVLWKGRPMYFAETAGTTSGNKYIPITKASLPNHMDTAKHALLSYIDRSGNSSFVDGNMIFLSGSPKLEIYGGVLTGRLSGIVNHHVPGYLRRNQLPSFETNCIEDWEAKVERIVDETIDRDMRLISGIPPWVQMYFERLIARSGKKVGELFPNLSVFAHGGVNFEPYRQSLEEAIGRKLDTIETYPASEGFIAFQDSDAEGLLLNINAGIYFEFIPADKAHDEDPPRLALEEIELGENYAIVMSTNAGLWGYLIGDTLRFVSKDPYRILVSGRLSHYISAFGEHVIAEEVEMALLEAAEGTKITEFTVAPQVQAEAGSLPYHEWFIEFTGSVPDLEVMSQRLDDLMRSKNSYYKDLVKGKVLAPLRIRAVGRGAFRDYMKDLGKLGGQNKLPRLSNDRKIVDQLQEQLIQ